MKTMEIAELVNWYDELNFYIHPSSAIVAQHVIDGISKTIDFGVWIAGNVFLDSTIKLADILGIDVDVKAKAEVIRDTIVTQEES